MANISGRRSAVAAIVAACALGGGSAAAAASSAPTLGSHLGAPTKGFGVVKPRTVSLGGDPTGTVTKLNWKSWGKSVAVGTGSGFYVPEGQPTAGAVKATVMLKASSLGTCKGHKAYKRLSFTFEYNGESHPGASYGICGHLS
jgi:hypothetical protein